MASLKDLLWRESAKFDTPDALYEHLLNFGNDPIGALRAAIRADQETDSKGGRAWVLMEAAWLAGDDCRRALALAPGSEITGLQLEVRTAERVANTAVYDPELPRLVANADGALEHLTTAAREMQTPGGPQRNWLQSLHNAYLALGLVEPTVDHQALPEYREDAPFDATTKMLKRHGKERRDVNESRRHEGFLALAKELDH